MTWQRSLFFLGLVALLLTVVHEHTHLVISASQSLPHRIYLVLKGSSWRRGDIVTIQGHRVKGTQSSYMTKAIKGIEGDVLSQRAGLFYVNGEAVGPLQTHTRAGILLQALASGIIPRGHVFVAGSHPQSFDSRYQEFGLVRTCHILGRSLPLW